MEKRPVPLSDEVVTEHTAQLWKYRPLPPDAPEPGPESASDCRPFPGGKIVAARARGKKHKHEGLCCDDWYEAEARDGLVFAAVADGAGSRPLSRVGARVACRAAVESLGEELPALWTPELREGAGMDFQDPRCLSACGALAQAVGRAVQRARGAVEAAWFLRAAQRAGEPLDLGDLASTLLVSAVVPAGAGERLTASCQIGDGLIALLDPGAPMDRAVKRLGTPDSGAFSGETDFLTSARFAGDGELAGRTALSRGKSGLLVMMTDGVADDYFDLPRLYLDLLANGVLKGPPPEPEALALYKKLSEPVAYPSVSEAGGMVPLHYVRRDLAQGISPEELWSHPAALALAGLEPGALPKDAGARLLRWLDNYVERGSFDDRTLVLIQMEGAEEHG